MKKCLIVLTNSYPYSSEEAFFEAEVPYLADEFDKIITLAIGLGKDAQKTRKTPDNVDSYNISETSKSVSRALSLLRGAVTTVLPPDKNIDAEAKTSLKKRVFYEYFRARGEREYSQCKKVLEKYDFSQFDSITVYSYWFFVTAYVATKVYDSLAVNCKNMKLISRAHGYDVYRYANSLNYLPMREYFLSRFDNVYTCSADGAKHILEKHKGYEAKVSHSYLGTEASGVSEMNDDCFHIVSCSRMVELKRIDRIATALSLLEKENLGKIRWTHIGDGETMEKVRAICAEKLSFMEVNLIGMISNTQVLEFYNNEKIDLLVNVSTTEGLPVSMMEAISFSVPVLATDVGGVSEIIRDGFNGFIIPSDFTDRELADKIKEIILSDKEDRQVMRDNARRFWSENFDSKENYSQFAKTIVAEV